MNRRALLAFGVVALLAAACSKNPDASAHTCDADAGPCYTLDLPEGRVTLSRDEVRSRAREAYIAAYGGSPEKREAAIRAFRAIAEGTPPGTSEHDESARVLKSLEKEGHGADAKDAG